MKYFCNCFWRSKKLNPEPVSKKRNRLCEKCISAIDVNSTDNILCIECSKLFFDISIFF